MAIVKAEEGANGVAITKGTDYLLKEILSMKVSINKIETSVFGIEEDNSVSESLASLSETVSDSVLIAKKYEEEFANTYDWDLGLIWSKSHGLGGVPDIVEVWAKFSGGYYMKLAHQHTHSLGSTNTPHYTSIVADSSQIRFESSDDPDTLYFSINNVLKDETDITNYKIIAIKF